MIDITDKKNTLREARAEAILIVSKEATIKSIQNKTSKKFLNQAGITASNRDALIPQPSNRLLFTQSKEPMVRMLGQFLSWAMAKSSQTNKILMRIENGNTRTLIKTLAALPVYAGIQQLREIAKHGDVITDAEYNTGELVAKSWQLSGMPGWLSDLVFNRFVGPGASKENPFYIFAPALNIAAEMGFVIRDFATGKIDDAKDNKPNIDIRYLNPGLNKLYDIQNHIHILKIKKNSL